MKSCKIFINISYFYFKPFVSLWRFKTLLHYLCYFSVIVRFSHSQKVYYAVLIRAVYDDRRSAVGHRVLNGHFKCVRAVFEVGRSVLDARVKRRRCVHLGLKYLHDCSAGHVHQRAKHENADH